MLILDVARFKYPPHWVPAERLWQAMQLADPATRQSRGWMVLRPRAQGVALGFSVRCEGGDNWQGLAKRLTSIVSALELDTDLAALARAVLPLAAHLELRVPSAPAHRNGLAEARAALRALPAYPGVVAAVGSEQAETVTLLLLAIADRLAPAQRAALLALSTSDNRALAGELSHIRAQLSAVLGHAGMHAACRA